MICDNDHVISHCSKLLQEIQNEALSRRLSVSGTSKVSHGTNSGQYVDNSTLIFVAVVGQPQTWTDSLV
jgi:hypothetical protein